MPIKDGIYIPMDQYKKGADWFPCEYKRGVLIQKGTAGAAGCFKTIAESTNNKFIKSLALEGLRYLL